MGLLAATAIQESITMELVAHSTEGWDSQQVGHQLVLTR